MDGQQLRAQSTTAKTELQTALGLTLTHSTQQDDDDDDDDHLRGSIQSYSRPDSEMSVFLRLVLTENVANGEEEGTNIQSIRQTIYDEMML